MVTENAFGLIRPGEGEAFEKAMREVGIPSLAACPGVHAAKLGRRGGESGQVLLHRRLGIGRRAQCRAGLRGIQGLRRRPRALLRPGRRAGSFRHGGVRAGVAARRCRR